MLGVKPTGRRGRNDIVYISFRRAVQQIAVVILVRELQSTRRQVLPLKTNFPTNIHRENTSDEKYLRSTNSHPEKEQYYTVSMQYSVKFIRAALH